MGQPKEATHISPLKYISRIISRELQSEDLHHQGKTVVASIISSQTSLTNLNEVIPYLPLNRIPHRSKKVDWLSL